MPLSVKCCATNELSNFLNGGACIELFYALLLQTWGRTPGQVKLGVMPPPVYVFPNVIRRVSALGNFGLSNAFLGGFVETKICLSALSFGRSCLGREVPYALLSAPVVSKGHLIM